MNKMTGSSYGNFGGFFLKHKGMELGVAYCILMIHRKSALTIGKDSHSIVFPSWVGLIIFVTKISFNFAGSACVKSD